MFRKNICVILALLMCIALCGCNGDKSSSEASKAQSSEADVKSGHTTGTLDGITYTETDEQTDFVKIEMVDGGIMIVELYPDDAPITVANYKKLVDKHFYDGLIFHRVIENFMIQGGDPTGTGYEGSGETIKGEFSDNGVENNIKHVRGTISMGRTGNDNNSASSQFFICQAEYSYGDGKYAAFGKMLAGWDTLDAIATVAVDTSYRPIAEQKMKTIRFVNVSSETASDGSTAS